MKIEQAGVIILSIGLLFLLFFVQHLSYKIYDLENTFCVCENQTIENPFDDSIINQNIENLNEDLEQTNLEIEEIKNLTANLNNSIINLIERVNDYHSKEEDSKEIIEEDIIEGII